MLETSPRRELNNMSAKEKLQSNAARQGDARKAASKKSDNKGYKDLESTGCRSSHSELSEQDCRKTPKSSSATKQQKAISNSKGTFRQRFWSVKSANNFGDEDDVRPTETIDAARTRSSYVPRHAASDFAQMGGNRSPSQASSGSGRSSGASRTVHRDTLSGNYMEKSRQREPVDGETARPRSTDSEAGPGSSSGSDRQHQAKLGPEAPAAENCHDSDKNAPATQLAPSSPSASDFAHFLAQARVDTDTDRAATRAEQQQPAAIRYPTRSPGAFVVGGETPAKARGGARVKGCAAGLVKCVAEYIKPTQTV